MPGIGSRLSIGEQRGIATEALAVDPIISVRAELAAVAGGSKPCQLGAAAARDQQSSRILRVLRDDVDHAVDGVGAPQRCPWSADDFDSVDIREQDILHVPEHARKQRGVDGPAVDQDQQLVGGGAVEPPGADGPLTRIDLCNLQIRSEAQGFGKARCAGAANVILRDDLDRRWCFEQAFRTPGDGHDLDVHQLIEGEALQSFRGIALLRGGRARCDGQ